MNASTESPLQQTPELLRRLVDARVELVVIGGVAAVAWGSTQFTRDLDISAPFTLENLERLMSVLRPLTPRFYQTIGKPLAARTVEQLTEFKNLYFQTDLGIIDVLRVVPPLQAWETLERNAVEVPLFDRQCRIIGLDDLIAVKMHVRRAKDLLVASELQAIRDERNRRG
jgi:predicted nucleotidyltransferase